MAKTPKKSKKNSLFKKAHNLNEIAFGKAFAILAGLYMLMLGLLATFFGWGTTLVTAIGSAYLGFVPSIEGSVIGGIWGTAEGFIIGYVSAWLYNRFAK